MTLRKYLEQLTPSEVEAFNNLNAHTVENLLEYIGDRILDTPMDTENKQMKHTPLNEYDVWIIYSEIAVMVKGGNLVAVILSSDDGHPPFIFEDIVIQPDRDTCNMFSTKTGTFKTKFIR